MTSDNLFKKGIRALKERRLNLFLFGIFYFIISLKNRTLEGIQYKKIKRNSKSLGLYKIKVHGSSMYIDLTKEDISRELAVHQKRERFATEFSKGFIREKDTIIDIGANIGYYALLESKIAKKGKVYALEPVPKNMNLLKKNIKANNYKNIKVFQRAIGDKDGFQEMNFYEKGNWCSFTENPNIKLIEKIEIPLSKLDTFISKERIREVDFLRMDVEGYECKIIDGMEKLLKSNKPLKILMELHPPWLGLMTKEDMEKMFNKLKKAGLKIKAIYLEVAPYNYRSIKTINRLRKLFRLPQFGFVGNNYVDLERLLKYEDIYTPQIFLERN